MNQQNVVAVVAANSVMLKAIENHENIKKLYIIKDKLAEMIGDVLKSLQLGVILNQVKYRKAFCFVR